MYKKQRATRQRTTHNRTIKYYNVKDHPLFPSCARGRFSYRYRYFSNSEIPCNKCYRLFCKSCNAILNASEFMCHKCCNQQEFKDLLSSIKHGLPDYVIQSNLKICHMIASYSSGTVIECGNFLTCSREINYNNKYEFDRCIDIKGNYTYGYMIDDVRKLRDDMTHSFIYGQYRRIFCSKCTAKNLLGCQYLHCIRKDIKIQNRIICSNHIYCESCRSQTRTIWRFWTLQTCKTCKKYVCKKCCYNHREQDICPQCYYKIKKHNFALFLDTVINVLYLNLTAIISDYYIGGAMQCSNELCNNEIIIGNRQNLENMINIYDDKIYWYPAKKQARKHGVFVEIYDTPLIIFCADCTRYRLNKCRYRGRSFDDCPNKDALSTVCQLHPVCCICNYKGNRRRLYQQCVSKDCHKYICYQCEKEHCIMGDVMCPDCSITNEYNLYKSTTFITNINSTKIEYINCCNIKCQNKIGVNNKTEYAAYKKLYQYRPTFGKNTVKCHGGIEMRVFCQNCMYNELKKCSIDGCVIKDVLDICQNHENCNICNILTDRACLTCKKAACFSCSVPREAITDECIKCNVSTQKTSMIDNFESILRDDYGIKDVNIYDILAEYSIGYIIQCCNGKDNCNNEIVINNDRKWQMRLNYRMPYVDQLGINNVNGSSLSIYHKTIRVANISGFDTSVFCDECHKKAKICEYESYVIHQSIYPRYYRCSLLDVTYVKDNGKRICYLHPICGVCKLRKAYYWNGSSCKYCNIWICTGCDIEYHYCKQQRIDLKKTSVTMEIDANFEINEELMNIDRKSKGDIRAEIINSKVYFAANYGHKARKKKKRQTYFERKNDRKSNIRIKRKFHKRFALSLQY